MGIRARSESAGQGVPRVVPRSRARSHQARRRPAAWLTTCRRWPARKERAGPAGAFECAPSGRDRRTDSGAEASPGRSPGSRARPPGPREAAGTARASLAGVHTPDRRTDAWRRRPTPSAGLRAQGAGSGFVQRCVSQGVRETREGQTTAARLATASTRVATGTARSATARTPPAGSSDSSSACSPARTSCWPSLCPRNSAMWPVPTRRSSTAC
jgi:hypothetical protein